MPGRSELTADTIVIPYTVSRFFLERQRKATLFFCCRFNNGDSRDHSNKARDPSTPPSESVYLVDNLTQLLAVAGKTAGALTLVLC
jgi:hypothetical protein